MYSAISQQTSDKHCCSKKSESYLTDHYLSLELYVNVSFTRLGFIQFPLRVMAKKLACNFNYPCKELIIFRPMHKCS